MTNEIKWTDKLQAIAALIAILGGIAGFYKLFSTDKELERQLHSLENISKEQSEQTKILQSELGYFKEQITLLTQQQDFNKNQVRPDFEFNFDNATTDISKNADSNIVNDIKLINRGGTVYLLEIKKNKNNNCNYDIPLTYIASNGKINFSFSCPANSKMCLDFTLKYSDKNKRNYSQRFWCDSTTPYADWTRFRLISQPVSRLAD